eukprot:TRINITY_DN639_c0_g2_i1.p1 TRINITY_DN639_c0_g2~~TRINITY_DN639_c0_g2_i1.p1  ORF type:complete len:824 (+),score=166.61 TRINITY_DN639_c0_g2_i1:303-2774(+)
MQFAYGGLLRPAGAAVKLVGLVWHLCSWRASTSDIDVNLGDCRGGDTDWDKVYRLIRNALDSAQGMELLAEEWAYMERARATLQRDCVLGWATAGMSLLLPLQTVVRGALFRELDMAEQWGIATFPWVSWYVVLTSKWGDLLFDMLGRLTDDEAESPRVDLQCTQEELDFLKELNPQPNCSGRSSAREARVAAEFLVRDLLRAGTSKGGFTAAGWPLDLKNQDVPEEEEIGGVTKVKWTKSVWSSCRSQAVATAFLTLGLADLADRYHLTPGFAFYAAQRALLRAVGVPYETILWSPFFMQRKIYHLANLVRKLKLGRETGRDLVQATAADEGRNERQTLDMQKELAKKFPGLPKIFAPQMTESEQLHILQILQGLHTVLGQIDVPYALSAGTLLGAIRHHGFIPWDGDADIGSDILKEPVLLLLTLLQPQRGTAGTSGEADWPPATLRDTAEEGDIAYSRLTATARLMRLLDLEMVAHGDKAMNYKVFGADMAFIPGGWEFSYPNVEIYFWRVAEEDYGNGTRGREMVSLDSTYHGIYIPLSYMYPLEKVYFAGHAFWSYRNTMDTLTVYYGQGWPNTCVASEGTFFRENRKYTAAEEEFELQEAVIPCMDVFQTGFIYITSNVYDAPAVIPGSLERHIQAFFHGRAASFGKASRGWVVQGGEVRSRLEFSGTSSALKWPFDLSGVKISGRKHAGLLAQRERGGMMKHSMLELRLRQLTFQTSDQADMEAPGVKHVTYAGAQKDIPEPSCMMTIRMVPQLMQSDFYADAASADSMETSLAASHQRFSFQLEAPDGYGHYFCEVVACTCRHFYEDVTLQWTEE